MTDWQTTEKWITQLGAAARSCRTDFNGGQLQWHIWGSGPALLLLHGGSGSWTHWCRNIEFLQQHYTIYVPDLPGCGDSDTLPVAFSSIPIVDATIMLAEALIDGWHHIAEDNRIDQCRIMGFSLGSIVGTFVAARISQPVKQLILVGTSALGVTFAGIGGTLRSPWAAQSFEQQLQDQKFNLGLIMLASESAIDDGSAWIQLNNVKRARLRTHSLASSDVMHKALPELDKNTDVVAIWGDQDIYTGPDPDAGIAALRDLSPSVDVHVIGGGHWVMFDNDQAFNALVATSIS